jgi:transposase
MALPSWSGCTSVGAYIKVLDRPGLDLTTPSGRGAAGALEWPGRGRAAAYRVARERWPRCRPAPRRPHGARKPKLDDHQQREARERLAKGESCRQIARTFRVHHATVSRLRDT